MPTQCQVAGLEDALSRVIVFLVSKQQVEIMNYSLVGKARRAAKNTMQSKQVRAANVANYANREASTTIKTRLKWSANGETVAWVCQKVIDRSKSLKVN